MNQSDLLDAVVISMGDPAGVGPEVIHKALIESSVFERREVIVVGDLWAYATNLGSCKAMHEYHILPFDDFINDPINILHAFDWSDDSIQKPFFIDVGDYSTEIVVGEGSVETGTLAIMSFNCALELVSKGLGTCLVTAPFAKEWVLAAGFDFPGHTEALGSYTGCDPVMMLLGGGLKISLVTIHEPLKNIPKHLSEDRIRFVVETTLHALKQDFQIKDPKIAVCGLNPHAGESGKIGDEELKIIKPAVDSMIEDGLAVSGPYAGDTVFHQALKGEFDAVVAMYHDQGAIPVKLHAFDTGVNFTAGLPIVRTSPDHGTAFDIAGSGKADHKSMLAAIDLASAIVDRRLNLPTELTLCELRK